MATNSSIVTMTISLPAKLQRFVKQRTVVADFGSASDYIRELIRRDQRDQERLKFEAAVSAVSKNLEHLAHIPADAWKALRNSILDGEKTSVTGRFEETVELMKTGILMRREQIRKELPNAPESVINQRLAQWLHDRTDSPDQNGPGKPISEERLRRILGY